MKKLLIFDRKNYSDDMTEFEKFAVRAVIMRDGRLATQKGSNGEYKLLGGGMEPDEDYASALAREIQEEGGLFLIPESIQEIGEIEEKRKDRFDESLIFHCHSYFFFCEVEDRQGEPSMTLSEVQKGYHLVWATPEEIIQGNQKFLATPWIYRDTEFVKLLVEQIL